MCLINDENVIQMFVIFLKNSEIIQSGDHLQNSDVCPEEETQIFVYILVGSEIVYTIDLGVTQTFFTIDVGVTQTFFLVFLYKILKISICVQTVSYLMRRMIHFSIFSFASMMKIYFFFFQNFLKNQTFQKSCYFHLALLLSFQLILILAMWYLV